MARPTVQIAQVTSTLLASELQRLHVTVSRSAGHTWRTIRWKLAMRNILAPITLTVAQSLRLLMAELILVEWLFSWPGLGRLIATAISLPVLLVALGVIALIGVESGLAAFIVGLSLTGWADTARLVREQTRQIKNQLYIESAHSLGAGDAYILFKHVLRQVMPMGWMLFAFEISGTLLVTAGLGFLGYYIGGDVFVETSDTALTRTSGLPELGQMLATSWVSLTEPWGLLAAGLMVFLIVLAFNLLGQGLGQWAGQTTRTGWVNRLQDRLGLWVEEHLTYPAGRWMNTRAGRLILGGAAISVVTALAFVRIMNPLATGTAPIMLTTPGNHLWSADRHDPYGTLWTPALGPDTADLAWQFTDPTGYTGGMVIDAAGTLYLASQGGRVYALSPDGAVQWMTQVPQSVIGAPALDAAGNVFIADDQGALTSFAPDGSLRWRFTPQNPNEADAGPIVGPDGVAYYFTGSILRAISSEGDLLWETNTQEFNLRPTPPRLSPDGQYVFVDDVVLNTSDGGRVAFDVVDEAAEGTNTQFAQRIYMSDPAGRAYLTSRNVAAQWQTGANGPEVVTRLTWDPGLTVFGDPADVGVTPAQVIWRMFTASSRFDTILQWIDARGVVLGNVQFTHRPSTVVAVDGNDTLYTCGPDRVQENRMGCVAWAKGAAAPTWTVTFDTPAIAIGGALIDGRLYVVGSNGALIAIGNAAGSEVTLSAPPYGQATTDGNPPPAETGEDQPTPTPSVPQTALAPQTASAPQTVNDFFNTSYGQLLLRDPELVSELGLSDLFGIEDDLLTDVSPAYQGETIALAREQLAALEGWEFTGLSEQEQISYRVYEWYLQDMVDGEAYLLYGYPYNHLFGWPSSWTDFMATRHPLATVGDVQGYIARLFSFNVKVDQMIAFMDAQRALGIEPPRWMLEYVLGQVESTITPANEHVLLTSFQDRMSATSAFVEGQKNRFATQVSGAISSGTLTGYRKLAQYLARWLEEVDGNRGLGAHPGGAEAYAYALRHHTTTNLTAEEIHNLGLAEVERITAEMDTIFDELGISGATMGDKIGQVAVASGFVQGQAAVVDTYTARIDAAVVDFAGYFDIWPETDMEAIAFSSPIAPGAYYTLPSPDGSQPGRFFVNVSGGQYAFSMPTLAYHEGMPGHHYQIARQQEIEGLPYFRNGVNFTAYAEGWALYVEYLAWEAGIYDDDPYANIGRLQAELFRAARLVVDTGLHAYGRGRRRSIIWWRRSAGNPRRRRRRWIGISRGPVRRRRTRWGC